VCEKKKGYLTTRRACKATSSSYPYYLPMGQKEISHDSTPKKRVLSKGPIIRSKWVQIIRSKCLGSHQGSHLIKQAKKKKAKELGSKIFVSF
jgi:hypothetical protein